MKSILIVEDDTNMVIGLQDNLSFEGYQVEIAPDGEKGLEKIKLKKYDMIILDVMMPIISGFELCKIIRNELKLETPIIMLTAKGEEIDKVLGLELGADDYITKPFSVRELLARIKALFRRVSPDDEKEITTIGKLSVSFSTYQVISEDETKLSHKEFDLLQYLYKHKNRSIGRDELLNKVWGYEAEPTTRTVDNFILKLRQKIEEDPNKPRIIITVHGIGYKLIN